jgi:hypothetical protein
MDASELRLEFCRELAPTIDSAESNRQTLRLTLEAVIIVLTHLKRHQYAWYTVSNADILPMGKQVQIESNFW